MGFSAILAMDPRRLRPGDLQKLWPRRRWKLWCETWVIFMGFTRETGDFFLEVKMVIFQIKMVIFLLRKRRKLGIFGNLGEPNGIENWETTWWDNSNHASHLNLRWEMAIFFWEVHGDDPRRFGVSEELASYKWWLNGIDMEICIGI